MTIFFSCEDNIMGKDKSSPEISDVKVNWGRPIKIKFDSLQIDIINDKIDTTIIKIDTLVYTNIDTLNLTETHLDTLILGDTVFFSGYMKDDYQLSSFILRLLKKGLPTIEEMGGDTAFYAKKVWQEIYSKQDTLIKNLRVFDVKDSIKKNTDGTTINVPVATGEYIFRVVLVDTYGKADSLDHKVHLLRRNSLLK